MLQEHLVLNNTLHHNKNQKLVVLYFKVLDHQKDNVDQNQDEAVVILKWGLLDVDQA